MRAFWIWSLLFSAVYSYRFLMYIPIFGHSHVNFLGKIADTLTEAGHEVVIIKHIMEPLLVNKYKFKSKLIHTVEIDPQVEIYVEDGRTTTFKNLWTMSPTPVGLLGMAKNMSLMMGAACDQLINQEELLAKLKKEHFDVGITEPFSFCGFGILEILGIKTTIAAFSGVNLDVISHYIGEPSAYSYVPTISSTTDRMGILQRLGNAVGGIIGFWIFNNVGNTESEIMAKKFGNKFSGHGKLLGDTSFSFVNANPYLDFPRPILHKTIQVGGISVDTANPGKLDEKWDKILNERKQTVFISFGSVAKSKDMPDHYKENILKVCASMPDVTFIWKYEDETNMADHLKNVYLSPWLPQKALLADERLSLFVTHGGLGSTTEVAFLGKPAVFIPIFAEQPRNAAMLSRHDTAVILHKEDLSYAEKVATAIKTVLSDKKYAENAKKLAETLKNQPFTAKDLVVKHCEFAARFGPLKQLEPYGKDLSLVEYYLLDVFALVIGALALLISIPVVIVRKCCCSSVKVKKD